MLIITEQELNYFLNKLENSKEFTFDLETQGLYCYQTETNFIIGLAFYLPEFLEGFYIPVNHLQQTEEWLIIAEAINTFTKMDKATQYSGDTKEDKNIYKKNILTLENRLSLTRRWEPHKDNWDLRLITEKLKPIFTDPDKTMITWNGKFDVQFFTIAAGYSVENKLHDAMLLAHLSHSSDSPFELDRHAEKYLKENKDDQVMLEYGKAAFGARTMKTVKENLSRVPLEMVAKYAIQDCSLSYRLRGYYLANNSYKPGKLEELFEETSQFERAILQMEMNGLKIDEEEALKNSAWCKQKQVELIDQAVLEGGLPDCFNPGSVKQVRMALYGETEGPAWSLPTDQASLLETDHPIARLVAQYRICQKADSSYFSSLLEKKTERGYVHPSFKIHGTVAFRLSGGGGLNFQAIPRGSEVYKVKECVICEDDEVLMEFDFCLHPDTLVKTAEGDKRIADIKYNDVVFSYCDGYVVSNPVTAVASISDLPAYRLTFDNGESVIASSCHKWPTRKGAKTTEELQIGERMIPLKQVLGGNPNKYVHLYANSSFRYSKEHVLVAESYYGKCPKGYEVHHKDGNSLNNHPDNLEYKESHAHKSEHGKENYKKQDHTLRIEKQKESIKYRRSYDGNKNPNYKEGGSFRSNCLWCDTSIVCAPSQAKKYCNRECYNQIRANGLNHKLVSKEFVGLQPMHAITVANEHNYALSCGVFTMNSQIELRMAAHDSQDPVMLQAYHEGLDLHTIMACKLTGKTEVTKQERTSAKAVNFGFLYGMSWQKFKIYAKNNYGTELTDTEAQKYRDDYFNLYPNIKPTSSRIFRYARDNGYVELWTKKRRFFDREEELHTAWNNRVQGNAAELMRISITKLDQAFSYFEKKGAEVPKMMLTVHDSLLLRCKEDKWELWADLVKKTLEKFNFRVPIVADCKVGRRWSDLKEIK